MAQPASAYHPLYPPGRALPPLPAHPPTIVGVRSDLQAAARVWRDGQRKKVYVYRFLAAGTLQEKVFQRQLSKKGLQTIVVEEGDEVNTLSSDDLRCVWRWGGAPAPGMVATVLYRC